MDLKKLLKSGKTWYIVTFVLVICVSLLLFYFWLTDQAFLARITINYLVRPVIGLGLWGFALYFVVMGIQGLLIPIPSELILLVSGLIWGLAGGTIVAIIGSICAGLLCYFITVKGGRPIAERLVGEKWLKPIDTLISRYGTWFIFIARAVPMMAFDPISYVGGLLKVDAKKYTIATLLGSIPRALFYAFLGSLLQGDYDPAWTAGDWETWLASSSFDAFSQTFNLIFIIILVVLVAMFLVYNFIIAPRILKKDQEQALDNGKDTGTNTSHDGEENENTN